jgi:anti-sigma B factor antagonist
MGATQYEFVPSFLITNRKGALMTGGELAIRTEQADGWTVVSVAGEIDIATVSQLRPALESAVSGGAQVTADLSGVTFMDSTGLGVLIQALKHSQATGGDFRLVVTQPNVKKVLEITGLTELFSIHDSLADALAPVSPGPLDDTDEQSDESFPASDPPSHWAD